MPTKETIFSWTFPEYEVPTRSTWWYVIAGLIVGLLLVWSIAQQNYTFPLLIIMVTIILFAHSLQRPAMVVCTISDRGIEVGEQGALYSDIDSFWILETEVGDALYIQARRGLRHITRVPLVDQDTSDIHRFLSQYLEENDEYRNEPVGDWLARRLRF